MTARKLVSMLRRRGYAFSTNQQGVSAVEFALLLPLMLTMYFGSIEVTDAVSADRQVALVATTVADITAQYQTVTTGDVANILAAASAVLAPFSATNAKVTLSSVVIDANLNATVDWSRATANGTPRPQGSSVTSAIPAALRVANTSMIWGEATYAYKPLIGWVVTGTLNLSNQMFMRPRLAKCVQYTGVSTLCP
jgi:Flp pilus assembly protein TadG